MIGQFITIISQKLLNQPPFFRGLVWVVLFLVLIVILYVLFSLLFFPLMALYNRLTDKNESNVMAQNEYLLGELTEKIEGSSVGEVMEIGSKTAHTVYPAKFYRTKDQENNLLLTVGTKVLIIDFDEKGRALVIKSNHYGN